MRVRSLDASHTFHRVQTACARVCTCPAWLRSASGGVTLYYTCRMHPSVEAPYAHIGGCETLPVLGFKHPRVKVRWKWIAHKCGRAELFQTVVILAATLRVCICTCASTQASQQPFTITAVALTNVIQATGSGFSARVTSVPQRSLAAARVVHDGSLAWQEAQELPPDEAGALAALWSTVASHPGASNESINRETALVDNGEEDINESSSPPRNSPEKPKLNQWRSPTGSQKPRYRVIGDGEGGTVYELAEELNGNTAEDIFDFFMTERGQKRKSSTTTTTTPPPVLRFRQCADASARGYAMPFACCSVQNGDFYDKRTWHCGRIPTSLDAVFVRHFVRLPASRSKLELRALWLVRSIDAQFEGKTGVLRSGQLSGGRCWAETSGAESNATAAPSVEELNTLREVLGGMLSSELQVSKASLSDVCASLKAEPFFNESDFTMGRPTALIIKDPGTGPLGPTAAEIAYTGTTESLESGNTQDDETDTIVDRHVHVERNLPTRRSGHQRSVVPTDRTKPSTDTPAIEEEDVIRKEGSEEEKQEWDDATTSPIVPFDFGRAFQPAAGLAARLPPLSLNPYFSASARGLGTGRFSRQRKFFEPLSLNGSPTLRIEPGAALLFLSGY